MKKLLHLIIATAILWVSALPSHAQVSTPYVSILTDKSQYIDGCEDVIVTVILENAAYPQKVNVSFAVSHYKKSGAFNYTGSLSPHTFNQPKGGAFQTWTIDAISFFPGYGNTITWKATATVPADSNHGELTDSTNFSRRPLGMFEGCPVDSGNIPATPDSGSQDANQ